jgi:hypothetical protein
MFKHKATRIAVSKMVLAGAIAMASMSPTFAVKMTPQPCAKPDLRCTGECDKDHWCKVYACTFNKTVQMPFPCNEKAGGCLQSHC